jgi:4-hydroxy-2-oxoheptanedioate aldolase
MNSLFEHLSSHDLTWAINVGGPSLDAVDMLAAAGAKCLFIDCERTAIGIESIGPIVRSAKSYGMFTMLRSESKQPEILIRYLDRGIDGIVVPHTDTVEELEQIAQILDYVSKGQPEKLMSIAQIESQTAVDNIVAMSASKAVDSFLIGPNDLSHSMGFKGSLEAVPLWQAIDGVIKELQKNQRLWGIPGLPSSQDKLTTQGAQFLYCTLGQIIQAGFKTFKTSTS